MSNNVKFKIVILGTQGVGKTCLFNRLVSNKFVDKYESTCAGVYRSKACSSGGQIIQVGIWDTVGTERYKSLNQLFYRGAKAAIVCYDVCDMRTWHDCKYWLSELRLHEDDCKVYLCGTKTDLIMTELRPRGVDLEMTSRHAAGIQAKIMEISSKTGENVDKLFQMIVDDYVERHGVQDTLAMEQKNITLSEKHKCKRFGCCSY